jgi:hypothetical protein
MPETDNDPSGSTAMFRAFAQGSEDDVRPGRRTSSSNHTIIIAAVVVACVVVLAVIVGLVL